MSTPRSDSYDLPQAPPAPSPVDRDLRRVIVLLFVNLGLSVLATILIFAFHDQVTSYLIAHSPQLSRNPAGGQAVRQTAHVQIWSRSIGILVASAVYVWLAFRLRAGKRSAYRRVWWIAIAGSAGLLYLILAGQYPVWLRIEQGLQMVVLLLLLWSVSRPAVRARFAKPGPRTS